MHHTYRSKVFISENGGIYYTVEAGDTLYKIARRYNLRVYDLLRANPNANIYNLQVGERIFIPTQEARGPEGTREYIVRSEDTLFSILNDNNLSYEALEQVNREVLPGHLMPGVRLWIPMPTASGLCSDGREYIIGDNEGVRDIALARGVTVDVILMANPTMRPNQFIAGARICIPNSNS